MKKYFLFALIAVFFSFCFNQEANSQAFDYLKKTKSQIKVDPSKRPTQEQLYQLSSKLSNIYYQYYYNNNIVTYSNQPISFLSKEIKQEDLCQKNRSMQFSEITYSIETGLPVFINLNKPNIQKNEMKFLTTQTIFSYLNENRNIFKIEEPDKEFSVVSTSIDNENNKHIKLQQVHQNIPIWGKELVLHFDSDNELYLINGKNFPTINNLDVTQFDLAPEKALVLAINDINKIAGIRDFSENEKLMLKYTGPTMEKVIWFEKPNDKPRVAWMVEIRNNFRDKWRYFIDAQTGDILEKYNTSPSDGPAKANARDALGNNRSIDVYLEGGNYLMVNTTKPMYNNNPADPKGIILTMTNNNQDLTRTAKPVIVSSINNQWNDAFSVSAHYNSSLVFDYYKNTHNRNSLDDKGMNMLTIIHITDNGKSFDNAYWNGQFVVLGDGGQITNGWPPALDFLAHEFTHGVVTFTVDLEYKFQSGALNEAFADWGGCMIDRDDWLMGEDIVKTQYFPTGCMRSMSDPHNGGTKGDHVWLPAHMNEFLDLPLNQDNGGVHYNCGIINKATYLIGNSIGKDKLEKIYYRVLNNKYITKQANFIDMRLACIKAAEELYGMNSNEVNVVKNSFFQVGIGEGSGSNPDPDLPPVEGTDWVAVVSAQDFGLYIAKSQIQNVNTDIKKLTSTKIFTNNNGTLTVPENGSAILFIDENNALKLIKTDGTGETFIDQDGVWRSIAISPNGQFLAATSVSEEPKIYIFDLVNSQFKEFELYIPTTGDNFSYNEPLLANTMSWDVSNRILVYDALNYRYNWSDKEELYFDMNALDPSTGVIYRILPTLGPGVNAGSPDFGKTSKNRLVFLVYNANENYYYINGLDLYSGTIKNILYSNGADISMSSPVYSPKDNKLAFQAFSSSSGYSIWQIPLGTDKISPSGNPTEYLINAGLPKWFAIGKRPVSVDQENSNYFITLHPNPASDFIEIYKSTDGSEVRIFNILGECVLTGEQTFLSVQRIDISLLPKGIYFVRYGDCVNQFIKI